MPSIARGSQRKRTSPETLEVIRTKNLGSIPALWHGFSTRPGGVSREYGDHQLNLGFTASDSRTAVERNRRRFVAEVTGAARNHPRLLTLRQIHSGIVCIFPSGESLPPSAPRGDGAITNHADVLLAIQTADCVPVLVTDARTGAVGAFHAGWRGTVKRIVERGVGSMRAVFGSQPRDLFAAIGPCIHQCCYAVGDEVIEEFRSQFIYGSELFREVYDLDPVKQKYPMLFLTARAPGHSNLGPQTHLDLVEANRRQLVQAGVQAKNIWVAQECTSCRTDLLFSHRGEAGYTGRMMAVIGTKSKTLTV
jgi:YfiH family protein